MLEKFQMLDDPRFHLLYGVSQRFGTDIEPRHLRLNREGFRLESGLAKGMKVYPYMRLATHPSPYKGDVFSPVHGVITDINNKSIFVEAGGPDPELAEAAGKAAEKRDLLATTETGEALRPILKGLGLNTRSLGQACDMLIINGLNPDPGVTWAEPMLISHFETVRAGLALLRRLSPAKRIVLAVPEDMKFSTDEIELVHVPSRYPSSLNPLLIKAVTGEENPAGVAAVGLHNVWSLGRVVKTGLPLVETVLTVGSLRRTGNYVVKDGSYIGEIIEATHITLKDGDTLVRGGPLRGESLDRPDRSVTKGSIGIFVVEAEEVPAMEGHAPCINCGACIQICPARLNPAALSRYAEFALHERNRAEYIDYCMECGLCGYVCIARRPVLQYIRLSKHKLGLDKESLDAARLKQETGTAAPESAKEDA